jgi:hypothetical protein
MGETTKKDKNEGEGNKTADRHYREGVRQHIESGKSGPAAKEATKAVDGEQAEELRRAQEEGRKGRDTR